MLAAAGFIGWGAQVYRSGRLKPTPFFTKNENWQQDIVAILEKLGEPPYSETAVAITHSAGSSAVQRTMVYHISLTPEKERAFLRALQERMREKFLKAGCKVAGEGSGAGVNDILILGYSQGPVFGTIQICISPADEGHITLVVTMQEQRGSTQSFGLQNMH